MIVGDSQKLEGTSDIKQRPLDLTVCEVCARRAFDTDKKDDWSETEDNLPLPSRTCPLGVPCMEEWLSAD